MSISNAQHVAQAEKNRKLSSDPNSTIQWLVAQDSASGDIAAILKWEAFGDLSAVPHQTITDVPYGNAGTAAFADLITLTRREYMGNRPHLCMLTFLFGRSLHAHATTDIHIFATHPQHQRRGAGRALLAQREGPHILSRNTLIAACFPSCVF